MLPVLNHDCAPTTYEVYNHVLENHVWPALGDAALASIRSLTVTEFLQKLSRTQSTSVATQARSALSRVLQLAVLDGRLTANPVASVRVGGRERKLARIETADKGEVGKRWLSLAEGRSLLTSAKGTVAYFPILLGLRFGLRSGESLGLTWQHINLECTLLRVRQQAQSIKGTARLIGATKSAAGIRYLPIPQELVAELSEAKRRAVEDGGEWVCSDASRHALHPKHVSRLVREAMVKAGFDGSDGEPIPTSHDLRSSYLTWLANHATDGSGVKPHVLITIAGHSSIDMAMRNYVRANAEDLAVAANSIALELNDFSKSLCGTLATNVARISAYAQSPNK